MTNPPSPNSELEYLQHMFMQVPAMIAVLHGPSHVFDLANPRLRRAVGATRRIIGKPVRTALPELVGQHLFEMLDSVYATGEPQSVDEFPLRIARQRGKLDDLYLNITCQPISSHGQVMGIFVHAVDVTAQFTARRELEDLAAELQAVFESLPEGLFIADTAGIQRVNQQGAELLGYADPSQVPLHLPNVFNVLDVRYIDSGEPVPPKKTALQQALTGKRVQYECIATQRQTGRSFVLRVAAAPIKNAAGKIIAAVAITSDITERARLEEKIHRHNIKQKLLNQKAGMLRQQNNELKELNRSKDEFIALASHQLRTPATGVKQYIGMLIEGYIGAIPPRQKEFLQKAYESNERQLSTINDLLQIAQIDANKIVLNRVSCDIGALIESVVQEQRNNNRQRNQQILVQIKGDSTAIVDQPRLRMVFDNILDNAGKYSPTGTTITVTVVWQNNHLVIKIADQGVGISEQDFIRLFQKFSRIDNPLSIAVGGNGLGLYLAKRIIDAHHGTIAVTSRLRAGTTFTITLPRNMEL